MIDRAGSRTSGGEALSPAGPRLRRVQGWEGALARYIERHRDTPFEWGVHDCGIFAAGAVLVQTGCSVFPTTWKTHGEARRKIAAHGGLAGCATLALGPAIDGWKKAGRGAIALVEIEGHGPALAVCTGATLCGPGPDKVGLLHLKLNRALKVWVLG